MASCIKGQSATNKPANKNGYRLSFGLFLFVLHLPLIAASMVFSMMACTTPLNPFAEGTIDGHDGHTLSKLSLRVPGAYHKVNPGKKPAAAQSEKDAYIINRLGKGRWTQS